MKAKKVQIFFLVPSFLGLLIFYLYPVVSLFFRQENVLLALESPSFVRALGNNLLFLLLGVASLYFLSQKLAFFLSKTKHLYWLIFLLLLPMAIQEVGTTFFWRLLFEKGGYLNQLLFVHTNFLENAFSVLALILIYIWKNIGIATLIWLLGILYFPQSVIEMARIDGASEKMIRRKIILPNLAKFQYTLLVIAIVNSHKIFRVSYLLVGAYPNRHIYLLQNIFNNWFRKFELGKIQSGALLYLLIMLVIIGVIEWRLKDA